MSADKAVIQEQLSKAWQEFGELVEGLSEREMLEPGVVEGWSVKDMLGHIAFWAQKAADDLKLVAEGRQDEMHQFTQMQEADEWNAREWQRRKDMPLAEIEAEWERSHEAARAVLESTPAEKLDLQVTGRRTDIRFAGDTFLHYREHAEQIRAWQQQLETTEG